MISRAGDLLRPLWVPWVLGPEGDPQCPVLVSVTEYTPDSYRHYHAFVLDGLRLRQGWFALDGAVALALYGQPLGKRGGSLSIWTSEEAMRRFVRLPRHVEIMRRYRRLGVIRAITWEQQRCDRAAAKATALRWLAS